MIIKNEVKLYGKVVSIPEFRSETKDNREIYQCIVEVPNKSIRNGVVKEIGHSYITIINLIDKSESLNEQSQEELHNLSWINDIRLGDLVEVIGQLAQDRIGRSKLGTSSVYLKSYEILDKLEEYQGNAVVSITGEVYRDPVFRELPNSKSEKLTFLLNQKKIIDNVEISMKTYVSAFNNLAHRIKEFNLVAGDKLEVIGNLVSRKYRDKNTNQDVNVCELISKRVNLIEKINSEKVDPNEKEESSQE